MPGILHPADAQLAIEAGVDGRIVSDHGGRELDTAISGLDKLPDITAAVRGRMPIIVDDGIHRGANVLKALAFGAKSSKERASLQGIIMLWRLTERPQR